MTKYNYKPINGFKYAAPGGESIDAKVAYEVTDHPYSDIGLRLVIHKWKDETSKFYFSVAEYSSGRFILHNHGTRDELVDQALERLDAYPDKDYIVKTFKEKPIINGNISVV